MIDFLEQIAMASVYLVIIFIMGLTLWGLIGFVHYLISENVKRKGQNKNG